MLFSLSPYSIYSKVLVASCIHITSPTKWERLCTHSDLQKQNQIPATGSPPKLAKKKVSGARRVWGTMSMCSESAVNGAIERICGISSICVRRKTH